MTSKEYEERIRKAKEKAKRNKERGKWIGKSFKDQEYERESRRYQQGNRSRGFAEKYEPF